MERYLDISEDQVLKLREGLELLETLDRDAVQGLDLFLYGLTRDPQVLDAAREAIASDSEDEIAEDDVQLGEIAIAIPISSDTIYALTGSGIKLKDEYFAYSGGEGEGTRRSYMFSASYRPTVTTHSFSHMALAASDSWIDDYLEKTGGRGVQPTQIKKKVQRTEEATQPSVPTPAEPQVPVEAPPAAPAATPKQTSLNTAAVQTTFEHARKHLMTIGMTLYKKEGEYRVNFKDGSETSAYYTDSLQDAISTAEAMTKQNRLVEDFLG